MTKPTPTPNHPTKRLKRVIQSTESGSTESVVAPESAVLRDRAAPHERAFVDGKRSSDPLAEEMAEDAVRAMTSGEDETAAERGDAASPGLQALVGRDAAITEDDPDELTTGEFERARPPA
jgi:hypothetical protein